MRADGMRSAEFDGFDAGAIERLLLELTLEVERDVLKAERL